jgi:hypothetical protein
MAFRRLLWIFAVLLASTAVFAQQTGSISGKVTSEGQALPGVTVEARSNVLPQPRTTVTDANGEYRLPQLVPGSYTVTYTLSGMQTVTRKAEVLLGQNTPADVKMGVAGVAESITVTAESTFVNKESTAIESGISEKEISTLPIQQNYGDLQKLIPGVMFTPDTIRGPSAGASGQANVYMFDGANITMPLFGILNQQPNTHDIAQVNIVKGGAKAVDFNRAGGFQIDTVSKTGTNKFSGEIGYQARPSSFVSDQVGASSLQFQQDRSWSSANLGGPIVPDQLFFYGSYFRPYFSKSGQTNVYGDLPGYKLETNEFFGKLTYTPTQSLLFNGTYRQNKTKETPGDFTSIQAPTTGSFTDTQLKLGTLEGSWIINPHSFASAKFTDYRNPGNGPRAQILSDANFSTAIGTQLDIANLANQGRLILPTPLTNNAAQNAFVAPFINQYGYVCPQNPVGLTCTPGQTTGGGTVGYGQYANNLDNFYRKNGQLSYNLTFGSHLTHDLHAGYQRYNDSEDRLIQSNGWGVLTIPAAVGTGAGSGTCPASVCGTATPAFFVAQYNQQGAGLPTIHSEFHSQNLELNDTMRWANWSFNAGLLASNDVLYGQGLAKADNVAGYVKSPGTKYKMHEFGWSEELQPRLGATWAYNGNDTVFTSFARYYPAANSDARAASWDRNLQREIFAYFDATGKLVGSQANSASSGKWWQEDIKPPRIDEFLVGTARQLSARWSGRLYGRYRKGTNYIEDVPNDARRYANNPAGTDQPLFVPNLGEIVTAIGSGSSYVIANLDGAFTKYLEATAESEWRGDKLVVNGSYTWSHFYGNFDQDNTSFNSANDTSIFIGSSNIGDGPGRQLWDYKYGNLRGDRRNVVKLRGTYFMPWNASVGAFGVFQSGQPYQLESALPYLQFNGGASETNKYAEPAGARVSPSHYNIDLNYTQNFALVKGLNLQLAFDVFNVTDKQTGYNYATRIVGDLGGIKQVASSSNPCPAAGCYTGATVELPSSIPDSEIRKQVGLKPDAPYNRADYAVPQPYAKNFYDPRRFQIAVRLQF